MVQYRAPLVFYRRGASCYGAAKSELLNDLNSVHAEGSRGFFIQEASEVWMLERRVADISPITPRKVVDSTTAMRDTRNRLDVFRPDFL